jgi:protein required for attachment to host cells
MAWAKLHTDILGDPKLMRAARKGAKELVFLPWLIAFAKEADDSGRLSVGGEPAEPADIADLVPGATRKMVAESMKNLEQIGVLHRDRDGFLCFAAWERRSGGKPSDSAEAIRERVTAFRKRRRDAQAATAQADTEHGNAADETPGNAVTETRSNATEKRREEKRRRRGEENGVTPAAVAAAPPWLGAVRARWLQRVGRVSVAAIERELAESVPVHGAEKILGAIDAYADTRIAENKPMKIAWFAEEIGTWVARTEPVVDGDGLPTERGLAIMAGARA